MNNGNIFEALKQRISHSEAAKRTDKTHLTIAVATNKQTGEVIIRFDDHEFAMSKKKALALAEKIQKKAGEL